MKNIILMYNPKSGDTSFRFHVDTFIEAFSKKGYIVHVLRSNYKGDMEEYLAQHSIQDCDGIFVAGGDGSVNEVMNGMLKNGIQVPLGIIPAGTANDFARALNIPSNYEECVEALAKMQVEEIDVGCVNQRYFINVCSGGLFTTVSQNIDIDLKNTLGKLAYYLKAVEQIHTIKPIHLKLNIDDEEFEDDFYIFMALNSSGAGGFYQINPGTALDDGLMEFFAVRAATSIKDVPRLLMKFILGEHINDKSILFKPFKKLYMESSNFGEIFKDTDIDGEAGPDLPIQLNVIPRGLKVFSNREQ